MPLTPGQVSMDDHARATIKRWMHGTGATQATLAQRIGKTPGWVSRYLLGDYNADLETLRAIAEAFGHPFCGLFDEVTSTDAAATRLVSAWRALPSEARTMVIDVVDLWARPYRSKRGPKR
jgi:transcriptional regulator with XRE-family HTH domain